MIQVQRCKITVLPFKARFSLHPERATETPELARFPRAFFLFYFHVNRKMASGQNQLCHSILSNQFGHIQIIFKLKGN